MASTDTAAGHSSERRAESYRLLADVFHEILSEQSLSSLLDKIADTLSELVPYDSITVLHADEANEILIPVLVRDQYAEEILSTITPFGKGITGWAVQHRQAVLANEAHLDDRVQFVPGTPIEPEALICLPLIARGRIKGALNLYRHEVNRFEEEEFDLAKRFGDAAALALDNAESRAALEHQAQTDALTGLYNHRFFQERLRSELARANRAHDSVAILMFDIDDFKKLNDVHGHSTGDQVLVRLGEILKSTVRASDVACRIGGEEFALILPSCGAGDAFVLSNRLRDRLRISDFESSGHVTISVGIAQGPEHAANPRELVACAEAAMMTAKARGKDRVVLFDDAVSERPTGSSTRDDVRYTAHLKMLQSLASKLNRLNDVRQIGDTIANELRTLIDYHNCGVFLAEGELLRPIASHSREPEAEQLLPALFGQGITGTVAATGKSLLVENVMELEESMRPPVADGSEESIVAVPLLYGSRTSGVIVISKLGLDQFDEDDVRLLEVLAGQASVALENARLYEAQRRQAENANALLAFADEISKAPTFHAVGNRTAEAAVRLLGCKQASLWLLSESGDFRCAAHHGFDGDRDGLSLLRNPVSPEEAHTMIRGRTGPFVVTPEQLRARFEGVDDLPLGVAAIAPLPEGAEGWIAVRRPAGDPLFFTPERLQLLAGLSYQASHFMQRAQLYRDQKESAEIANALLDVSRELSSAQGLDEILGRLVELSARVLGAPRTAMWLAEPGTDDMVLEACWGVDAREREGLLGSRLGARAAGELLQHTDPYTLKKEDYEGLAFASEFGDGLSLAMAPIRLESRSGCLMVAAPALGTYEFSERKMRLLAGIVDQAKLAISEASSFENLERTFVSTVEALANALEAKDEYTSSHTRSIVETSLALGERLGLDMKALKQLELVALFHDIGKIGIPSHILLKPGPLTEEEREIVQTHTVMGERILSPIQRLSRVRKIVRSCHEHFDGSGYPDGKAGEDIPIEARIVLVCDAFDAMTTDRPYRERLSDEEAFRRLREAAGSQFDPRIVDTFFAVWETTPLEESPSRPS
jgi:diguanylate cyclase (GGDEF)-like protein